MINLIWLVLIENIDRRYILIGIGSRIREIKRCLLHEKNKVLRKIYIEHIKFLESELGGQYDW